MRSVVAFVVGVVVACMPVSIGAWGLDVHRFLTGRSIDGLPEDMRPFFAVARAFISEHSVDPDMWRIVGVRGELGDEPPNHFLDIDGLDEPPPFANVPRDWAAYVARYGEERANRMGRLPWRADEVYGRLVQAFVDAGKGAGFAGDNARYLVAVLAHYVQDAHQPLHAVLNYDGQLTNQRGVHSRFETQLVLRNLSRWTLEPVTITPIPRFRDYMFDTIVASQALAGEVLAADRLASGGRDVFDDAYYAAFERHAGAVARRRLSEAASGLASVVVAAWAEAGKPALRVDRNRSFAPGLR